MGTPELVQPTGGDLTASARDCTGAQVLLRASRICEFCLLPFKVEYFSVQE